MKQFLASFLGSCFGVLITGIVFTVVVLVIVIKTFSLLRTSTDSEESSLYSRAVIQLNLEGDCAEKSQDYTLNLNSQSNPLSEKMGVHELCDRIRSISTNDTVKALFIRISNWQASLAVSHELRKALEEFKKTGKKIWTYADAYNQNAYYLASVSNSVAMNPSGTIFWKGLAMEQLFFTQALRHWNIEVDVYRCGKYKSAVEPFYTNAMSPESRYQNRLLMSSLWSNTCNDIAQSRSLTTNQLNDWAEHLYFNHAQKTKVYLVDTLVYESAFTDAIKKQYSLSSTAVFTSLESASGAKDSNNQNHIAVVLAEGTIVDGPGDADEIGSETFCKTLQSIDRNPKVKGVVLRINSPGGSAFASEQIWYTLKQLARHKPLIISMGNVAASGGYYIACAGSYIMADPFTITGSIGVFGMVPQFSSFLKNQLNLSVDTLQTHSHSHLGSLLVTNSSFAKKIIQTGVDSIYQQFLQRVAGNRHWSLSKTDSVAQGRVWSAAEALKVGLIDQMGSLHEALQWIRKKHHLESLACQYYPKHSFELKSLVQALIQTQAAIGDHKLLKPYKPFINRLKEMDYVPLYWMQMPQAMHIH